MNLIHGCKGVSNVIEKYGRRLRDVASEATLKALQEMPMDSVEPVHYGEKSEDDIEPVQYGAKTEDEEIPQIISDS